jgi:hypothetical protein
LEKLELEGLTAELLEAEALDLEVGWVESCQVVVDMVAQAVLLRQLAGNLTGLVDSWIWSGGVAVVVTLLILLVEEAVVLSNWKLQVL